MKVERGKLDAFIDRLTTAIYEHTGVDLRPETINRMIVDMPEWDGAASNYSSTDAYCRACLIDVNEAAGRTEKVQSHCKLPVRSEDDDSDTYVMQAIFAASGGRGVTQVVKPDDVSQGDWDAAVKSAAMEIIAAYEEMDRIAPASVYEVAGEDMPEDEEMRSLVTLSELIAMSPKDRATAIGLVWQNIYKIIMEEAGEDEWGDVNWENMPSINDIYFDNGVLFMIYSMNGMLYRRDISLNDGEVMLGEPVRVFETFIPTMNQETRSSIKVSRQADGRYRGLIVASTAVLNRVGEIDSTKLHDSFVHNATETGNYPAITVWHLGEKARIGQADYVAREGFCYLVSFLFDDNKFGEAAARGMAADTEGYWGSSIEFFPTAYEILRIGENINVPVYTEGTNPAVTILAESKAASLFTSTYMERSMDQKIKQDIVRLFGGNEELADEFAAVVDGNNAQIRQNNLIARNAGSQTESTDSGSDANTPAATTETNTTIELDDELVRQIVAQLETSDHFKTIGTANEASMARLATIESTLTAFVTNVNGVMAAMTQRLNELEQSAMDNDQRLRNDAPVRQARRVTYRPSVDAGVSPTVSNPIAGKSALDKIPQYAANRGGK